MNINKLEEVKKEAKKNHIPIVLDDTLNVIEELINKYHPKEILEIGTAVGYSACQFVKISNENAFVDTIELDEPKANTAKQNIEEIGLSKNINVLIGDAVKILPELNKKYDMIFIDANKSRYEIFLREALRLSHKDTVIVADNVLYKGYVLGDYNKHKQRTAVNHLRGYLAEIVTNENLDSQVLNVGDGLAISIVRS